MPVWTLTQGCFEIKMWKPVYSGMSLDNNDNSRIEGYRKLCTISWRKINSTEDWWSKFNSTFLFQPEALPSILASAILHKMRLKAKLLEREQDDPVKNTIQEEMCHLFETLDALSHSHFVPFKHSSEVTVVQNRPALTMEETGQEVVSTADLLAPEEVCPPRGEVLKGSTETTSSDRRRHRKKLMRIRSKRLKFGAKTDVTKDKKAALARILRMAHKPGSKVKVV
ncbi:uncharacterized protein DEA37_0010027 [Paragonimus westermani]|uniref:Uncharacterized protein n=1 Tax=Paragonimus westermani TaxID=34504 RepID=A0A5J4NSM7_9TREM|nr:uncharacterized protein DEA37_0010027 [Paragonimus westermani]